MTLKLFTLLALLYSTHAISAEFTVEHYLDYVDVNPGDGICDLDAGSPVTCSLRAAIQEANLTPEDDIIYLPENTQEYRVQLTTQKTFGSSTFYVSEDENLAGDFDILQGTITIVGDGTDKTIIDGRGSDRVFDVHYGAKLILNNTAVTGGQTRLEYISETSSFGTDGGGIRSFQGAIVLNDVHIYDNDAHGMGGGIYMQGTGKGDFYDAVGYLEINNSQIYNNRTQVQNGAGAGISINGGDAIISGTLIKDNVPTGGAMLGGGIYSYGNITIKESAIIGHQVITDGGGIYHGLGDLTIINTTISGNHANRTGGGIYYKQGYVGMPNPLIEQKITLTNVTLLTNTASGIDKTSAGCGDGFFGICGDSDIGVLGGHDIAVGGRYDDKEIDLSIVNSIVGYCEIHPNSNIISYGNNINVDNSCNFIETSDSVNTNPMLNALAENGSYLLSYAPGVGSPATNGASDWYCPTLDQRGIVRPETNCDIGAFEDMPLLASNQVYAIEQDNPLTAVLRTHYTVTTNLLFEIMTQPTKGKVGLYTATDIGVNYVNGLFSYVPDLNASGTDSFTFRATNTITGEISNTAEISIHINAQTGPVYEEVSVEVVSVAPGANTSPVIVVNNNEISPQISDVDFNFPMGVLFFSVDNIPVVNGGDTFIELLIEFPHDTPLFPSDAVVRKYDKFGRWRTLSSYSATESYANFYWTWHPTISGLKLQRIQLVLRDNDDFDNNDAIGIINDPIAIGIPKLSTDNSGVGPQAYDNQADSDVPKNIKIAPDVLTTSKGAGSISIYFGFFVILLSVLRRRRK